VLIGSAVSARRGWHARRLTGWLRGSVAPTGCLDDAFGSVLAFSHLIDVPGTGKTAAVLRAARESLGDGRLLIVDDAHLLDKLSAALVYQLAVSGAAKLIVTVAPNGPVAEEISALWRDDLLARIDVAPPGHDDSRQATLVEEFVAALPGPCHWVLEYLAVEDPLSLPDVSALAGRDAVTAAEAAGAIVIDEDASVRRTRCSSTRSVTRLVNPSCAGCALSWWIGWSPRGPAAWWTGYGSRCFPLTVDSPQPVADLAAAAEESLRLGDLELSDRLGRARGRSVAGPCDAADPRLCAGVAGPWPGGRCRAGRGGSVDAVRDRADGVGAAARGQPVLDAERTGAGDRVPSRDARQVSTPAAQTTLDALSATFAMNAGSPSRAKQIADQVLARPRPTTPRWDGRRPPRR